MEGAKAARWYILIGLLLLAFLLSVATVTHADVVTSNYISGAWGGRSFGSITNPIQTYSYVASSTGPIVSGTVYVCLSDNTGSPTDGVVVTASDGAGNYATSSVIDIGTMPNCAFNAWHAQSITFAVPISVASSSSYTYTLSRTGLTAGVATYATEMSSPPDTAYSPFCIAGCGGTYYPSVQLISSPLVPSGSPFYSWPIDYASGTIDWNGYISTTASTTTQPLPFYLYASSSSNASSSLNLDSMLHLANGTGTMPWTVLPSITISSTTDSTSTDLLLQEMGASATSTVSTFFSRLTGIAPFSWFFMLQQAYRGALPTVATSTFVLMPSSTLAFASTSLLVSGISGMSISFGESQIRTYISSDKISLMRLMMASALVIVWGWSLYHRSRLAFTPTHTV